MGRADPPLRDEEIFLTEHWPRERRRWNVVNGMALVATDVLDRYRRLSERELSHSYYRLLGEAAG